MSGSHVMSEERKGKEECTYTYIHTHTTFYTKPEFQITMQKLKDILRREGKTLSQWISDNAQSYVRLHEPGNPQQRIDVVLKTGKAYKAPLMCACGRKASRRVVLPDGAVQFCCSSHMPKNRKMWKVLR